MIDRGALAQGFAVLVVLAAVCAGLYALFADTEGTSGNLPEDSRVSYGRIYEQPDKWSNTVLADRWLRQMKLQRGTFGSTYNRQVRIGIDGSGPITEREVTLETPAAVALFQDERRERAVDALHGIQRILDERGGLVRGVALTESASGAQAAAIAAIIRNRSIEDYTTPEWRELTTTILDLVTRDLAKHAYAWYDPRYEEIVLGPKITNGLLRWIRTPDKTTPDQNIFTAYVLRHELEHAISPMGEDPDYARYQWIEEGGADALARWAGAAATTARELGMTYPERYDTQQFTTNKGGYPEWTDALRVLLMEAGADWREPDDLGDATKLLQSGDATKVPEHLADRIAKRNRLTATQRDALEREILAVAGDVKKARKVAARY